MMIPNADNPVSGLTKREYFASLAMQGYCVSDEEVDYQKIARWAVKQADALIEELAATSGNE